MLETDHIGNPIIARRICEYYFTADGIRHDEQEICIAIETGLPFGSGYYTFKRLIDQPETQNSGWYCRSISQAVTDFMSRGQPTTLREVQGK